MVLTNFKVENYKSLQSLDLPLGRLNILVGPNGSGKSNILDALAFTKRVVAEPVRVQDELAQRGGYETVVWGGETNRNLGLELSFDSQLRYSFGIGKRGEAVVVLNEAIIEKTEPMTFRDRPDHFTYREKSGGVDAERTFLKHLLDYPPESPTVRLLLDTMSRWAFYGFSPREMSPPQPVRKEDRLTEKGENLSTVLHALPSDRSPFFDEVSETFRAAVPTVDALLAPLADQPGLTQLAVKERGVPSPVPAWGMSDGSLLILALSVALLAPKPPTLLVLEAPDTELHPYLLESVAEMLRIASTKTQVIATTHNPYLLNYLPPESLIVVEKENGRTRCKRVGNKKQLVRVMRELSPGEAWYSGHLGGVP